MANNTFWAEVDGFYHHPLSHQEVPLESYLALAAVASHRFALAVGITRRAEQYFVQSVSGLALNVEEHPITQTVVALDRVEDWRKLKSFPPKADSTSTPFLRLKNPDSFHASPRASGAGLGRQPGRTPARRMRGNGRPPVPRKP